MITSQEIIDEANTWLGTKFKHQGRVKNVGVDCYGLIISIARKFNLTNFKAENYGRKPNPDVMWKELRTHLDEISVRDLVPGCILFIAFEKDPMHLAIYDGENIIHSFALAKKVVKQRYDQTWKSRVRGAFRFRGVQY